MEKSRGLLVFIFLFVVLSNDGPFVRADSDIVTELPTPEEEKILLDCQNPNYQTYIKCLKHPNHKGSKVKRHHHPRSEESKEIDHHCMESCLKNCETTLSFDCNQKCSHCVRRTKHRHQIITEYETECSDGSCREPEDNKLHMTNISTSIDIKNIINTGNHTGGGSNGGSGDHVNDNCNCTCCPTCRCPSSCCGGGWGGGGWGGGGGWSGAGGTQLTLVPQLTLGLGLGIGGGGCSSPYPWLCPPYQGPPGVDCSPCRNPFLRYKCDVSCYSYSEQQGYSYNTVGKQPCQSPQCVGGM